MKKTLVALAVAALAATSANAAVVYNQDGTKLDINGSVRVLLDKTTGNRTDLKEDGSRVNFAASQDLGNGLSAVGYLRLKVDSEDTNTNTPSGQFNGLKVDKLYAGLAKEGIGALTFGKQDTTADDVQLGDYTYVWGGNSQLKTSGDKVVKFRSADFSGFSFGADYGFSKRVANGEPNEKAYGLSAFYTGNFADDVTLNANLGYTINKKSAVLEGESLADMVINSATKEKAFLLATELKVGSASFAVDYGQAKLIADTTSVAKIKTFLLGAKYDVTKDAKVFAQFNRVAKKVLLDDAEAENKSKTNTFILGAGYNLHNNVETFVQYAREKTTEVPADNKFAVGLRVSF